jgi:glycosyltransferase involved in cell wall biosynthesis
VLVQEPAGFGFELLVVDNASVDRTASVCAEYTSCRRLRYLHEPRLGLCRARNTGWQAAAGRYVAYLDDDAVAAPGWLRAIADGFRRSPEPGVVGGPVRPIWEAPRPHWLDDELAVGLTIIDWSPVAKLIPDLHLEWLVGANLAVPVRLLRDIGGFHPSLDRVGQRMLSSGDVFLQQQIQSRGRDCFYHPDMAVAHLVPASRLTQRWFVNRYYWQGISDAVMQLLVERPTGARRAVLALGRALRLLGSPRLQRALCYRGEDPVRFTARCFALIELGHVAGLAWTARA